MRDGLWETLEPQTGAVKIRDPVFIMVFNEDYTDYREIAYGPITTNCEGGKVYR